MSATLSDILNNIGHLLGYNAGEPMLFSSGTFWTLFMIFLPVYCLLQKRLWQMIVFTVLFSLYFYYKCSGWFVLLLAGTSLVDWLLSRFISSPGRSAAMRKAAVAVSLLCSLGVLAYFKYANFIFWNWAVLNGDNFQPLDIFLPVGISFYTFQSVSYIIDVYKGRVKATATWLEYAFFLTFFPALVAGPIVRADYFQPQIRAQHQASRDETYAGLWLIIIGVVKKAVIADYIAQYNDLIFANPGGYSGFETVMGIIGYTMQIYCDFSGYSDMAIGIALIMGFRLAKNFDFPYKSRNLTDFWRRWHISLSSWLRDYVYIPLGGNRKGTARTYINNFATMLIGGLWHGAAWKFVFWGGMHGAGLAIHKASKPWLEKVPDNFLTKSLFWLLTMTTVALLWVFFRADSWSDSITLIKSVANPWSAAGIVAFASARMLWLILMGVIIIAHCLPRDFHERACRWFVASPWVVKLLIFIATVQCVLELRSADVAPFIYFQF